VDAEVAKIREQAEKRRADEYVRRRMEQRQGEPGAPAGPGAERPAPERMRAIMERLRELPPESRERILRQLEESIEKAEAQPGAKERPEADRPRDTEAQKPAPPAERSRPQPRRKRD
jgi:hypothetical protein